MADFRERINELENNRNEEQLQQELTEKLRVESVPTSVNPLAKGMFNRIAPDHDPLEYARKSEYYTDELKPVAKRATGLKHLLHEQIGRPLYERIIFRRKKERLRDYSECIVAIEASDDGYPRAPDEHFPTTLPIGIDTFSPAPERSHQIASPFETIADLVSGYQQQMADWMNQHPEVANSLFFVYVLDCTPDVGSAEPTTVRQLRGAAQTKLEHGDRGLDYKERAAAALNDGNRIYYVGRIKSPDKDVKERVQEHVEGAASSAVGFTTHFPPQNLVEIRGCSTDAEADRLEADKTRQINATEGLFAYSDKLP